MPASKFTANGLLNLIFGAAAWSTKPSTLYFALFTANPTADGGGTEVSGSNYSRKAITANTSNFSNPASAGDNLSNAVDIEWARASGAWGTVTGWGIYDAPSSGNLIWYEALNTPVDVGNAQQPKIAASALTFSMSGQFGDLIEQKILKHLFRAEAWSAIGTHYLALGTGASSAGLTGEPSGDGYARKSVTNNTTNYPTTTTAIKTNGAVQAFPTATGSWGTITHFGIYDASTSGNLLWFGEIPPVAISSGVYQFAASELQLGIGA